MRTNTIISAALITALAGIATADDLSGSNMIEKFDYPTAGGAEGPLVSNDSDAAPGINPDLANPALTHAIDMDYWSFEVMHHVTNYPDSNLDGVSDGANGVRLGVRGWHLVGPHTDDAPTNQLPLVWSSPNWIPWQKWTHVAVSATVAHPSAGHEDWYGASSLMTAFDADLNNGLSRRVGDVNSGRNPTIVGARHAAEGHTTFDWNTVGRPMPAVYFDPDTGILHFPPIFIDPFAFVDFDGGRTGTIDPAYANDPIIGSHIAPIDLRLVGVDENTGEYIFTDGAFDLVNPDESLRIQGRINNFRVSSGPQGPSAHGSFATLEVIDTNEPPEGTTNWTQQFVRTGWFGEGLSDADRDALERPVLALISDLDLVLATEGFTRAAEIPATMLLTILISEGSDCIADFNHDGVIDFFDILAFLSAFDAGEAAADLTHDGDLDFFDVLAFLQAFADGCP